MELLARTVQLPGFVSQASFLSGYITWLVILSLFFLIGVSTQRGTQDLVLVQHSRLNGMPRTKPRLKVYKASILPLCKYNIMFFPIL